MLDRARQRRPLAPGVFRMKIFAKGPSNETTLKCSAAGRCKGGQRHIQRVNEAARLVSQLDLAFKLLAERLNQTRAEAPLSRRLHRGAVSLSPAQMQTMGIGIKRPGDGDAPGRHR